MGIAQRARDGRSGRVYAQTVENVGASVLMPHVMVKVLPATTVYTDEWQGYSALKYAGYAHGRVNHSERVYVSGDVHVNTIEGFWSLVKRGISGVHHSVSAKHLQGYLDEYSFRYNHRRDETPMFKLLLENVAHGQAGPLAVE